MSIGKLMLRTTTLAGLVATLAGVSPTNPAPAVFAEETVYAAVPLAPQGAVEAPAVSSSNGTTTLYIQNKEANAGSVFVTFYKEDGTSIDITACLTPGGNAAGTPIASNGQLVLNYGTCSALTDGDKGSSVVSSDVDVAVSNINFYANKAKGTVTGIATSLAEIIIPAAFRNFGGFYTTSSIYVMNGMSSAKTARISFFKDGVSGAIASGDILIPPFSSKEIDMRSNDFPGIPDFFSGNANFNPSFRGSVSISSIDGGQFAASVDTFSKTGTNDYDANIQSFSGLNSANLQAKWFFPILRRDFAGGFNTTIQMFNPNASIANITVTLNATSPSNESSVVNFSIPANSPYFYVQGQPNPNTSFSTVNLRWSGSGVIESSLPVAVTVRDSKGVKENDRSGGVAYSGFNILDGSNTLYAPIVYSKVGVPKIVSAVRVQNIGNTSAIVRIEYTPGVGSDPISGEQLYDELVINPGFSKNFVVRSPFNRNSSVILPANFKGSAKIYAVTSSGLTTLDPNAKLIGVVVESTPLTENLGVPVSNLHDVATSELIP